MKYCVSAGQQGYFIPKDEFEKGLWLDEEQKTRFQELIDEQNKLISELIGDETEPETISTNN